MNIKVPVLAVLAIGVCITLYTVVAKGPAPAPGHPPVTTRRALVQNGPVLTAEGEGRKAGSSLARGNRADALAAVATRQPDLDAAASALTFIPSLPEDVGGRGALAGLFTYRSGESEKHNVLNALYDNGLLVIELVAPDAIMDAASFRASRVTPFGNRSDEVVRSTAINGTTVLYWDPVNLPEVKNAVGDVVVPGVIYENAEVSWLGEGVVHVIGSPSHTSAQLLAMARSMIR